MIYIFEAELPLNKSTFFSLFFIFGIGKFNSFLLCKQLGFAKNLKTKDLTKVQISKIIKLIDFLNFSIASELKKFKTLILKKLVLIKCYKGIRKVKGLPVRGQRTRTNSKTVKKFI